MIKLFYILSFLVLIVTNLVSSKVLHHADTIENVQNHKHHLSKTSLVHCGHRYCYSTDILYRKMMGLYCWNKTEISTHEPSTSRTCSPTVFNVPITATVRKKYRPTPLFQRKKLKHLTTSTTTLHHKKHTPSRPVWRATSTSAYTSGTVTRSGTPTLFSISQKLINEDQQQQLKNLDDFIIVEEEQENNEIDRNNSNHDDDAAADDMQYNNDTTDSNFQEQDETEEMAPGDTVVVVVENAATRNDDNLEENTQEQEDDESPTISTNLIDTTPPPTTPEDEDDEEDEQIIPIISAGMLPIIPGAIIPESPQDPNGESVRTHEMAVNNNVPNKALGIGLGVGVGCIAALGLVGLLFHSKKKKQQDDEQPSSQYTRWRPQSFMGVVASVVSKLPRSPSQRSKASSSGRAIDSSTTSAPSLTPVDEK
ncbi:hypothetical protein K501DRAFT_331676 [Backusella circina FSU 941]|nr:hypothetical protein K501DRAFT_331676 [Backusella circina FSU 941]